MKKFNVIISDNRDNNSILNIKKDLYYLQDLIILIIIVILNNI